MNISSITILKLEITQIAINSRMDKYHYGILYTFAVHNKWLNLEVSFEQKNQA